MTSTAASWSSRLEASFASEAGQTRLDRVFETGALRLRRPRGPGCEGIIVNTGGGIVGGDRLASTFTLAAGADVTLTTVAAEKIYRSSGEAARIETTLTLGADARLDWLPQETILFEASALDRSLTVDMAGSARLLAAEMVVFGRLASDEPDISGQFRDSWRVRRDGRLIFADETRLAGAIGAILDRPAVGAGARAAALVIMIAPDAEMFVDPLRRALRDEGDSARVEAGVSGRDGILVARALACSPQALRASMMAGMSVLRAAPLPRVWT